MQSIFTTFYDDDENVYLIDRNGNVLEYETLIYTGEMRQGVGINDWRIYANDKMRVKIYGNCEHAEILDDSAPTGKHTKPALHGADE